MAASSVTQTLKWGADNNLMALTLAWVASSVNGSVTDVDIDADIMDKIKNCLLYAAKTIPGAGIPPTSGYDIEIRGEGSIDLMGGTMLNRSNTIAELVIPMIAGVTYASAPIHAALSLHITGNSVTSATGTIVLFIKK